MKINMKTKYIFSAVAFFVMCFCVAFFFPLFSKAWNTSGSLNFTDQGIDSYVSLTYTVTDEQQKSTGGSLSVVENKAGDGFDVTITTAKITSCGTDTYQDAIFTVTITAKEGKSALVVLKSGGNTIKSQTLSSGDAIVDSWKVSGSESSQTKSYTISVTPVEEKTFYLLPSQYATCSASIVEDGKSYSVDSKVDCSKEYSFNNIATGEIVVPDGYSFDGWSAKNDAGRIELIGGDSKDDSIDIGDLSAGKWFLAPMFRPIVNSTPPFKVIDSSGTVIGSYHYLDYAAWIAAEKSGTVVVEADTEVVLASGTHCLIPRSAKLLIPCKDGDTGVFGAMPKETYVSTETPTTYRTLTVPNGVTITCDGSINVNGHRRENGQGANGPGSPKGQHGKLVLEGAASNTDAQLLINGALYCYGFAVGTGTVEVSSTGVVHELMQLYDWPGGSNMLGKIGFGGWKSVADINTLFFSSRYFIQNVEAPLKVYAGAYVYMEVVLEASSMTVASSAKLVSPYTDSTGLFCLGNGTGFVREYDSTTDRVTYSSFGEGNIVIGSVTVEVSLATLESSSYTLGINNALTIHVGDGIVANLSNRFALLPGSELIVDQGGVLNVAAPFFVVGLDSWTTEMSFSTITSPYYTDGRGINATMVVDASGHLEVNGTLNVTGDGGVYATGSSASSFDKIIYGSGVINHAGSTSTVSLKAGFNDTLTPFTVSNSFGLLAGQSQSSTDLKAFGNGTYYGLGEDGGNYWYTHRVFYKDSQGNDLPDETRYCVLTGTTLPSDFAHPTGYTYTDEKFEYEVAWVPGAITTPKEGSPYFLCTPTKGAPIKLMVAFNEVYYLENYVWLDGLLDIPGFDGENGSLSIVSDDDLFSLVVANGNYVTDENGFYYIVRRMVAKELVQKFTFKIVYTDAAGNSCSSDELTVDFRKYAEDYISFNANATDTETKNKVKLMEKMIAYGEAAKYYFDDNLTWTGTASDTTPTGSGKDVSSKAEPDSDVSGVSLKTSGANVYFDETLKLGVSYQLSEIPSGYTIEQIGLLVGDSAWSGELTTESHSMAYLVYNVANATLPGGSNNKPGDLVGSASGAFVNPKTAPTTGSVIFDLTSLQYTESFNLRPFVVLSTGEGENKTYYCVYGRQVGYSLEIYINRTYNAKESTNEFKNLLTATWAYAQAAKTAFTKVTVG